MNVEVLLICDCFEVNWQLFSSIQLLFCLIQQLFSNLFSYSAQFNNFYSANPASSATYSAQLSNLFSSIQQLINLNSATYSIHLI